jgi:type IV secretory pathway VirB2 component (pilin)
MIHRNVPVVLAEATPSARRLRSFFSTQRWMRDLRIVAPSLAILILPLVSQAQAGGSPFDTGFTAMQNLFTGTIAKVASLIAIVIGGYGFAHGEPGAKKALAGVAAGTGIAVLAVNVLSWLWGV